LPQCRPQYYCYPQQSQSWLPWCLRND
jgi:hypothetical protein